jgi:hypothetical protein
MAAPDFSNLIATKTEGFVGRDWVFKRINDWLASPAPERVFLLAGGPGTGKSAIAARLAQFSDGTEEATACPELRKGWLAYYHFCQAGRDSTIAPIAFVESLSGALANKYKATFGEALRNSGEKQIVINAPVNAGTVTGGARVTGVEIGEINVEIRGINSRPMFYSAVRGPLQAVPADQRIVILVDSLDEALTFGPEENITALLGLVSDFPSKVHFICTSRSQVERVTDAVGQPALDLIKDADPNVDELELYAKLRLAAVAEPRRSALAQRVAEKSGGNFLYAYYVLNELVPQADAVAAPDQLELPDKLEDVYRLDFERRIAASDSERWRSDYRPLLGSIAVAHGDGLTKAQLVGISQAGEEKAADVFTACAQYLSGGETDRPLRFYHQSFREFLLQDAKYQIFPAERHAAIARFMQDDCGANWAECGDAYALYNTPSHWADAARISPDKREDRTQTLIELVRNAKYQRRFEGRIGDLPALQGHLERALQVATLNPQARMLPWLIRAAKGLVAFRRTYLRAESVVDLAAAGKLDEAQGRLALFVDVDDDWHTAARLILAWLAIERDPAAAQALRDRVVAGSQLGEPPLSLLLARLDAALLGQTTVQVKEQPAESLAYGREIVNRISGQEFDREMLSSINPSLIATFERQAEMITGKAYSANLDGPMLVNMAHAYGPEGTALLDEYIQAHAGYNYVEYRNRSLWIVLQAVLRNHPDQAWVKPQLRQLTIAALSGGGVDFEEMLPLTAATQLSQVDAASPAPAPGASATLDAWRERALQAAESLRLKRHENDLWGNHKRRLVALMEIYWLVLRDVAAVAAINQAISALPGGFAGFQAPAKLRHADGLRACRLDQTAVLTAILDDALHTAHHIQDYHFCARITARCNAMKRWHAMDLASDSLVQVVQRLAQSRSDVEFAADHMVGEAYADRSTDPDTLPIHEARNANTLKRLAQVFQRPPVEFLRLNPQYGLEQPIDNKTPVRVPDPGFAPLLAVHLSARVLADDSLTDGRTGLIRQLLPVAASNPTTLDTVLSYLLIAAEPDDEALLKAITLETGEVLFDDAAAPTGPVGPDSAMPS